ncbi:hypothetical protein NXY15_10920 [Bacteroides thetaiotaomicron]|nr:hypothetical protein NXY15_10920 [Bacteroides thetaiotaomicron]
MYDYTYWVCPKFTDFQDTDVTGGGGYYTTQETVDLFFTKDGLTIEEDPGYDKFEGIPGPTTSHPEDIMTPITLPVFTLTPISPKC